MPSYKGAFILMEKEVHSIDDFLSSAKLSGGRFRFITFENSIDFKFYPNGSDNLIVFFNAAISRTKDTVLPVFSGNGAIGKVDANILMVSDPSLMLSDDLTVAWYTGSENFNLQQTLGAILKVFSDQFGKNRTILYGGSAGGFASIYYSSHIPNSYAVAANPQTNISKYYKRFVKKYFDVCFPSYSKDGKELSDTHVEYDMCDLFLRSESKLVYLQNMDDAFHIENHFAPFLESQGHKYIEYDKTTVDNLNDRLTVVYGHGWGEGHHPPPKHLVFELLNLLCKGGDPTSVEFKERIEML